jgi:hypothetical protein
VPGAALRESSAIGDAGMASNNPNSMSSYPINCDSWTVERG